MSKRTEPASEEDNEMSISSYEYGLRVYTNHSIEGNSVVDLVKSIAIL